MTALNALWTFTEISVRFIVLSRPRTCVIKRTVSLIIDLLEWALGGDVWFLKSPVEEMRNSSYSYWKWNFASWGLVITHLTSSMQTGRDYATGDINTQQNYALLQPQPASVVVLWLSSYTLCIDLFTVAAPNIVIPQCADLFQNETKDRTQIKVPDLPLSGGEV